jgi:Histidine kinase
VTGTRPLRELFATATIIVAVWIVLALFSSSERYRVFIDTGMMLYELWPLLTYYQLAAGLLWATFTPVILFIAERFPLVKPFRWQNAVAVLAVTPLVSLCRAALGGAVQSLVEGERNLDALLGFVAYSVGVRFHRNVLVTLAVFGVCNLLLAHRAAAASERQVLAARKELANEEVQRLRGAIQPGFFFGVLGAVKAQMTASPVVADRMIVQFGTVLRKMLELEERADVSLAEELDLVERCLALEATRTGGRFAWRVIADESLLAARVPPLVLHTVVASALLAEGADRGQLEIEARRSGEMLEVTVRNDRPNRAAGAAALEAARARLRRLFADRASLETSTAPRPEAVVLTMPFVLTASISGGTNPVSTHRGPAGTGVDQLST